MIITISEKDILEHPNNAELGEFIRNKYLGIKKDIDYDKCVECGATSPYHKSHHVDYRIGYIEGAGQGCFKMHICKRNTTS